ncbi:TatD family hydrolase [Shewanella sp. SR44-3]|uniref:TatD family hydrolase n=1 Tax=unclassified Shewanella TaxID=196818 RepID=UPI0015F9CE47|nr:TatD family hydrolase [Shewanella sp. SR44-3]MBB1269997.1 TatD family hydrolase [Shewanella sp. SR44-3]
MSRYIDIAVNLLSPSLIEHADNIINDAERLNVSPLIVIGSDLNESLAAHELALQYPRQLKTTAGVHPHQANLWDEHSISDLKRLASLSSVVAIGECGLDYNRDFSPRDQQRAAFEAQLALAAELNMPVLMHCREAFGDFIAILSHYRSAIPYAVLHCFTGNQDDLTQCLALDLHIGITGWVCDERRGKELAQLVPSIPDSRLLIETDSPYLLPRSMRPKPKSSKNLPQYLPYILDYIAEIREQDATELARICYLNSCTVFGLEPVT